MPKFYNQPYIPDYATRISYTAGNLQEYIGEAPPNSKETDSVWRIQKLVYNSSNLMTKRTWADGTAGFTKQWSNRSNFSYL